MAEPMPPEPPVTMAMRSWRGSGLGEVRWGVVGWFLWMLISSKAAIRSFGGDKLVIVFAMPFDFGWFLCALSGVAVVTEVEISSAAMKSTMAAIFSLCLFPFSFLLFYDYYK